MGGADLRDCGTCSACCRWPEISALAKPRGVTCSHLDACGYGCTVYALRPQACRSFRCAWIEGHGEARDIPDTSGVFLFRRDSKFGNNVLIAVDLGHGPMRQKKKAIKRISRDSGLLCLLVDKDNPEKILLAYSPTNTLAAEYPKLAHLGIL